MPNQLRIVSPGFVEFEISLDAAVQARIDHLPEHERNFLHARPANLIDTRL
jgi:hypothetical protein